MQIAQKHKDESAPSEISTPHYGFDLNITLHRREKWKKSPNNRKLDCYSTNAILWRTGILFPKLFWPSVRENCSSDQGNVFKFEAEGREFARLKQL